MQKTESEKSEICRKAAKIYVPHGLLAEIPEEWNCPWGELIQLPSQNSSKPDSGIDKILKGNVKKVEEKNLG